MESLHPRLVRKLVASVTRMGIYAIALSEMEPNGMNAFFIAEVVSAVGMSTVALATSIHGTSNANKGI